MKTAFLFSGQGAQYSGMGKELYSNFGVFRQVFDEADAALPFSVSSVCFDENESAKLSETKYCQPAILTFSTACFKLLEQAAIKPDVMAGLSLGEYSALTASGVFDFSDAVRLVNKRGEFMAEAVPSGQGAMSAVLGIETERLEQICDQVTSEGYYVICANYNAPGQIVISGEVLGVERAEKLALENGAKRAVRLDVSGPFHSKMLMPAAQMLEAELQNICINDMNTPVVSNVDADFIKSKDDVVPTLLKQIVSPVRWEQTIRNMLSDGVERFIELGPGKTLCAFVKKVKRDAKIYNIEDIKSYENVITNCRE